MSARPRFGRILVCPQEFKGSLTAFEAARAIAEGVRRAFPHAEVREAPMADGGPGTAEIVAAASGGSLVACTVRGPLGIPVDARYAVLRPAGGEPTAVVEAATSAGLVLVPPEARDPASASTAGVGEQVRDALDRGICNIVAGIGGTGTNDGGAGAAQALGLRLLDPAGAPLPPGGIHLARLARIDPSAVDPRLRETALRIAVDVDNPLLGPTGATAVYGPQKGVDGWLAPALEGALARWAERLSADLGLDVARDPGAGAGGGLPAGLLAAVRAAGGRGAIEPGAALVGAAIGLREMVEWADLVVTGEGRLDTQTGFGKTVGYVAGLAAEAGRPCVAVAGEVQAAPHGVSAAEPLAGGRRAGAALAEAESMLRAAPLAADAAERLARRIAG